MMLDDRNELGDRSVLLDRNELGDRSVLDDSNGLGHHDSTYARACNIE